MPTFAVVERRAVDWLAANRSRLEDQHAPEDAILLVRKALAEVSLLLGLKKRSRPDTFSTPHELLLNQVARMAARSSYRDLIARDHRGFLLYASTYAGLRLCSRSDREFEYIVKQAVHHQYLRSTERLPFRHLDLLHTLELGKLRHRLVPHEVVAPLTTLAANPPTTELLDSDKYAITHAVFYLTDFGRRPLPKTVDKRQTFELLDALLLLERRRKNADLVGELLCAAACLGMVAGREVRAGWQLISDLQDKSGKVSGPPDILHPDVANGDIKLRDWLSNYHTTIVAALAATVSACVPANGVARLRRVQPRAPTRVLAARRRCFKWLVHDARNAPSDWSIRENAALVCAVRDEREARACEASLRLLAARLRSAEIEWSDFGADTVASLLVATESVGLVLPGLRRFVDDVVQTTAHRIDLAPPAEAHLTVLRRISHQRRDRYREDARISRTSAFLGALSPRSVALSAVERHLPGKRSANELAEVCCELLPVAIDAYRLGEVSTLLHALAALGWRNHRICRDGLDYLLSQQDRSGGIGYPATDCTRERDLALRAWTVAAIPCLTEFLATPLRR